MEKVEFFNFVKEAAKERKSLYRGTIKDRRKLHDFLLANEWFGLEGMAVTGSASYTAPDKLYLTGKQTEELCGHLSLWLDGFQRENHEKLEILLRYCERQMPETAGYYREYIQTEGRPDDISSWRLLDFLLYHLPCEITRMDTEEAGKLVDTLDLEATRAVSELYAGFNSWLQEKLDARGWRYKFEYRKKRENIEAYTIRQFSTMAYCIFNEEHWKQEHLVEKACHSAAYANLWVFIAMHFVCGLRSTDIIRLPMPDLEEPGETFRERVMAGTVGRPERISQDLTIRIRMKPRRPHKTMRGTGIPDIKVYIPVSLEKPMGIILGIAASHCTGIKPGEPFIRTDRSVSRTRKFFGRDFMDALGGRGFASSRANKSYLQGLEKMVDASEGSVKGYMIAALARSHKGRLGTLPDVTDVYLKDAAFSGYRPEFIAREMFERGVFGFIPHLLLEAYAGKDYEGLTITEQTALIRQIGIRPSGIENIVQACEVSMARAREAVSEIMSKRTDIAALLQEIASGEAVGKQDGCLCVMSGGGFPCPFPERAGCIGCRYEIHTKAVLHELSGEYARMRGLAGGAEGWRYQEMLRRAILPVIGEYITEMKGQIPGIDMDAVSEILEGGVTGYAYSGEQAGGNGLQQISGS